MLDRLSQSVTLRSSKETALRGERECAATIAAEIERLVDRKKPQRARKHKEE